MAIDASTQKENRVRYIEKMQDKFKNHSPDTPLHTTAAQIQIQRDTFEVVQLGRYIHGDRYTENSYFCHQVSREAEAEGCKDWRSRKVNAFS
uniref:HDC16186 n=1 Tax=Drosophila melanogaster TaxID=7227 RepID=Q6IJ12_DROME|nr:TPA_inf: HDC16186 [Drosophila melanogaster]